MTLFRFSDIIREEYNQNTLTGEIGGGGGSLSGTVHKEIVFDSKE